MSEISNFLDFCAIFEKLAALNNPRHKFRTKFIGNVFVRSNMFQQEMKTFPASNDLSEITACDIPLEVMFDSLLVAWLKNV